MKVVLRPRNSGKTTYLVKLSAQTGAVIVCNSYSARHNVLGLAKDLKLEIPFPFMMDQVLSPRNQNGLRGVKLIFDDLDMMLERLTRCQIEAVSINLHE